MVVVGGAGRYAHLWLKKPTLELEPPQSALTDSCSYSQAKERTNMKLIQDSKDAKAKSKSLKPQVERRRRARMNRSLDALKSLLLPQEGNQRRVEKAEILENTVLFLQNTAKGEDRTAGGGGGGGKHSFQEGFSTCLQRAVHFLGPEAGGLRLGTALDASFAARCVGQDSAGVPNATEACSSSSSLLFRTSSAAAPPVLTHRSGHSGVQPRGGSSRSHTTPQQPQQPHRVAQRADKRSAESLWRPWP